MDSSQFLLPSLPYLSPQPTSHSILLHPDQLCHLIFLLLLLHKPLHQGQGGPTLFCHIRH